MEIDRIVKELKKGFKAGNGVTREEVEELVNEQILRRIAEEIKNEIRRK